MIKLTLNELINTKPDLGAHNDLIYDFLKRLETLENGDDYSESCPQCKQYSYRMEDLELDVDHQRDEIVDLKGQIAELKNDKS
jgi:hypothetical protein